jgi:hypothetical protein
MRWDIHGGIVGGGGNNQERVGTGRDERMKYIFFFNMSSNHAEIIIGELPSTNPEAYSCKNLVLEI